MQKHVWLILCSEVQAQIYDLTPQKHELWEPPPDAPLIKTLDDPEGQLKDHDLVSDKPGRFRKQLTRQGEYVPHESPHDNVIYHFAILVAHFLEHELDQKHFDRFIVCAEPNFYGILKQHCSQHLQSAMIEAIQKDYLTLDAVALKSFIASLQREVLQTLARDALGITSQQ